MRTAEQHREECKELLLERTPTSLASAEIDCGLRFSVLLAMPYFDPIKFTVIDPMHNLYLGTGKKMFKLWVKQKLLSDEALVENEQSILLYPMTLASYHLTYLEASQLISGIIGSLFIHPYY
jgi:hypothetical protein